MDVILKRAAIKARVRGRKLAKDAQHIKNAKEWQMRLELEGQRKAQGQVLKAEKKQRVDNWRLGPLAPRVDVGRRAGTHGTMPMELVSQTNEFESRRPDWFHLKVGDRVVVMKGRAVGKIADITEVSQDMCCVFLNGVVAAVAVPDSYKRYVEGRSFAQQPVAIHINDVRLVYPMVDSETGAVRDVLIDKLDVVGREWDKHKRVWSDGYRVIHGTNTIIPWPKELEPEVVKHDDDTPEDLVYEQTYEPSLMVAPMPDTVIDELRGIRSPFRRRRTYEEREVIETLAARKSGRSVLADTMKTPLKQLAELRLREKEESKKELTEAQLEAIGNVILQAQSKATQAVKALKS